MKGLCFLRTDKNQEENILGWDYIQILDRHLLYKEIFDIHTEERCFIREVYEYEFDCIADGDFVHITEEELMDVLASGCYELEIKGKRHEEERFKETKD